MREGSGKIVEAENKKPTQKSSSGQKTAVIRAY